MGTKVHYRSYCPGHDKMRDLNADAGNSWPQFYINKTLNEHLYNGCFPSPLNGYSEYDKEMLKQTMLEHEAIFRNQVYELHRLYGIQKDLMEEFQKSGLFRLSEHKVPSKPVSCSSQAQSDNATMKRQMPRLCAANNFQKMKESSYYDGIIYPFNFPESNLQSSSGLIEIETSQRAADIDFSFRKCPKKTLDFRLPAGAYIDDTEKSEEIPGSSSINTSTSSRICTRDSEVEMKFNFSGSSGKEDVLNLNYLHNKSLFTALADLNEHNRQTSLEDAPNSFPDMVFGPKTQMEENYRHDIPLSSTPLSLQNALTNDDDFGRRTFSNVFQGANNEAGKFPPLTFMSSSSHKEKDPMLCETVKLDHDKVNDIISIDHNEASRRFGHEQNSHFLISGNCPKYLESGNLGKLTSALPNSFSSSLKLETSMTLPLLPTWMKLSSDENHASSAFSPISNFDGSNRMKMIYDCAIKDPNGASGLNDGVKSQSHSFSQIKFPFTNINLNVEAENSCSGTQDGPTDQQDKATNEIDRKCEDLLPIRPDFESLEPSRSPSQVDLGSRKMNRAFENKSEDTTSLRSFNFEVFSSSLNESESNKQNNRPTDSSSTTKFITPDSDKLLKNVSSSSNEEKLVIDDFKHVSIPHEIKIYSSQKPTSLENNRRNSRICIDLNSALLFEDDFDSPKSSAKVQPKSPSIHSDPSLASREIPIMTLEEDKITSDKAYIPYNGRDGLPQDLCSSEIIIKEAAENIVKLSLHGFKLKDEIQSSLSPTPPDNALYIFAEMILSNNNSIELNSASNRDDEFDLFEFMTLKLEEIKPENLWWRPQETEKVEVNERSKASLLLAKPRKVQGKKRRQRKDFQKDILPALATLSRHESKEDIQAIGELMKTSGTPWQAGLRRRNSCGNSSQAPAGRKQQRKNASVAVAVVEISPPTTLFMVDGNNYDPEFKVGWHHMMGWGRTTRRCRSQRCPSATISSTLM